MTKLVWDTSGERKYETGVDHGVLFVQKPNGEYAKGVVWNGLKTVTESPEGAEENAQYADNMKYLSLYSPEEWKGSIEAFTYPSEFEQCDGTLEVAPGAYIGQQNRRGFALYYRTKVGTDTNDNAGYKHHFVYGMKASPSEKEHATVNDSPEPTSFSWDVTAVKQVVEGFDPSATFTLDSTIVDTTKLKNILDKVEGSATTESTLPTITELIAAVKAGG